MRLECWAECEVTCRHLRSEIARRLPGGGPWNYSITSCVKAFWRLWRRSGATGESIQLRLSRVRDTTESVLRSNIRTRVVRASMLQPDRRKRRDSSGRRLADCGAHCIRPDGEALNSKIQDAQQSERRALCHAVPAVTASGGSMVAPRNVSLICWASICRLQ